MRNTTTTAAVAKLAAGSLLAAALWAVSPVLGVLAAAAVVTLGLDLGGR